MIQIRPSVLYTVLVVSFLFSPISAAGAARIEVDSANFDMGMIHEGTMPSAKHEFKVKNAGTDTLRIERVKPG
jgi:hypothetical protein